MNNSAGKVLEIPVDSISSAISAIEGGANRLELCAGLSVGGLTPSLAFVQTVADLKTRQYASYSFSIFIIIRPRAYDFSYTKTEIDMMCQDVAIFKRISGIDGFVFGVLDSNGNIDSTGNKALIHQSKPLSTTFHRAFDYAISCGHEPITLIEQVYSLGFNRILTSGGRLTAYEGISVITSLVEFVKKRRMNIIIVPGSGVTVDNIETILAETSCREIHSSCKVSMKHDISEPSSIKYQLLMSFGFNTCTSAEADLLFNKLYTLAFSGDFSQMKMTLRKFPKDTIYSVVNTVGLAPLSDLAQLRSTVLLAACRQGYYQIVCYLVKDCQADVNVTGAVMFDNEVIEGSPPLWVAAAAGHLNIVEFLIECGAAVNATTRSNSTPLRAACYDGHTSIVKFLVQRGADIEIANRHGHTSLMISCYRGHFEVAEYLIQKGAKVNRASHKGNTALHDASEAGHVDIIKLLLKHGAYMQPDENNVTPIMAAALCMNAEIVKLLAQNKVEGADALELLGATVICKNSNLSQGIKYWRQAQKIRDSNSKYSKNFDDIEPVEAYDNLVEFRTAKELDALSVEPAIVHITALLIYERVLGKRHPDTYYYIRYRGAVLADGGDYHRCLIFWLRALDLQAAHLEPLCVLTQNNFVSFVELFSHTKRLAPAAFMQSRLLVCKVFEIVVEQMHSFVKRQADGTSTEKSCYCEHELDDDSPLLRCYYVALHLLSSLASPLEGVDSCDDDFLKENRDRIVLYLKAMSFIDLPNGFNLLHAICHDQSMYDDFEQPPVATSIDRQVLLELALEALGVTNFHQRKLQDCDFDRALSGSFQRRRIVNATDVSLSTPLHYAASLRSPEVVSRLLSVGAHPSPVNSLHETPLHLAAIACCSGSICCEAPLKLLLSAGAHPDVKAISGRTPKDLLGSDRCKSLQLFTRSLPRLECLAAQAVNKDERVKAAANRALTANGEDRRHSCIVFETLRNLIELHW